MSGKRNGRTTNGANTHRRVLVATEDLVLRESLYDTLTRHGCSVKTVYSGQRALASLKHERPDLLLADASADQCGGWGLPDRVRTFDHELPILVMVHLAQKLDVRTIRDIQALLPSNVSETALIATVDRLLATPKSTATSFPYHGSIMIVDDEPELLATLSEFLQARGCTVVTATSGEEVLTQLARCRPELVLLDIKMPGMDGLITLKKIKAAQPHLPVIMATAVDDEALMAQAFALGAYEYISKPYNLKALKGILLHLKTLISG